MCAHFSSRRTTAPRRMCRPATRARRRRWVPAFRRRRRRRRTAVPDSSSRTPSLPARRSAKSTACRRNPPPSAPVLQATNTDQLFGHNNHFVIGASFDYSVSHFGSSAELGTINPDFTVATSGVFIGDSGFNDGVSTIGPVSLKATNAYTGLYAIDAFDVTDRLTVTAGGRSTSPPSALRTNSGRRSTAAAIFALQSADRRDL